MTQTQWIHPNRLFHQAEITLGGRGAGRGRPSPTDLRRSISSAYYAVYHQILLDTAQTLFGGEEDRVKLVVPRWISHADVKETCERVTKCASVSGPVSANAVPQGVNEHVWRLMSDTDQNGQFVGAVPNALLRVTRLFPVLQDARHAADYDHFESVSRQVALSYAEDARKAVDALVTNMEDPYFRRFHILVVGRGRRF